MRRNSVSIILIAAAMVLCTTEASAKSICLDAGHGGSDPGATGCGMIESHNTLDSVKRLKTLMEAAGWTVYLSRSSETDVGLSARASYANSKGVNTFASIHNNAFNGSATGIETLCQPGYMSSESGTQAKKIQARMIAVWNLANRGAKEQNLAVTRETNMTATLSELAFIDNCSKDAPYLKSSDQVQEAMRAHCRALTELHNGAASAKCEGSSSGGDNPPPSSSTGKLMAGTFQDTIDQAHWLGGVTYSIGGKTQTSASSYAIMTFELPLGTHKATASKDGFETASKTCEEVTASATAWCSLALTKKQTAPAKGHAKGSVKDGSSSSNIAAKVSVNTGASANYDGKTDWDFELDAGTYTISASADGYDNGSVSCTVTSGNAASCPITLNPKKGTITGQVLDSESNSPIAASVKLGSQSVSYPGNGNYTFTVEAGSSTIEADAPDYEHGQAECNVNRGAEAKCNVSLSKKAAGSGTLKGTLSDANTGSLLAGEISVSSGQTYHYMGTGEYKFSLAAGEYTITGKSAGYADNSTKCTVKSGETTDCSIKLSADAATVTGTVFNAKNPDELLAATVKVEDLSVKYDGNSDWTLSIAPGKYKFTADTTDGAHGTATCFVEAGKTNECNIAVIPAGESTDTGVLRGVVYDSRNKKLYLDAEVEVDGYGSVSLNGQTQYEFDALPVGQHQVTAKANGYYNNTVTCEVNAVEPSACDIPLTIKPSPGSTNTVEDYEPKIIVDAVDSCSAQPLSQNHSIPAAIAALFGILTAFGIRRRKGVER